MVGGHATDAKMQKPVRVSGAQKVMWKMFSRTVEDIQVDRQSSPGSHAIYQTPGWGQSWP